MTKDQGRKTKEAMVSGETRSLCHLLDDWGAAARGTNQAQPPPYSGPDVILTRLVEHTNDVTPGACFVARVRTGSDGHVYIRQAIANGAALIVGQRPPAMLTDVLTGDVPYLYVPDTAEVMAWLAAAWYGFPARSLTVVGVTGTDGKTTTVNVLYHILRAAGLQVGMVSTVYAALGDAQEPLALHVTTPEAPVLQRYLRRMADAGLTHCVLEVTSHALAQHRVTAIDFDVAVVTNITHEHLDYHGDYEGYFAAKASLFQGLGGGGWGLGKTDDGRPPTAVLNRDDASYERLAAIDTPRRMTYGMERPADVYATGIHHSGDSTRFILHLPDLNGRSTFDLSVTSRLPGRFNVYNMLAAAAAANGLKVEPEAIRRGLEETNQISGRLERIDIGQPFLVLVDFAHSPNALEKAIEAARSMAANGRVITVFGSAGRRDVEKRTLMGQIAGRLSDLAVLTAEDPRTESLDDILEMMAAGCRRGGGVEGKTFWRVPDRGQAVYFALERARPGDVVLICGKGHEQSMCFGTVEYPWDDRQVAKVALEALLAGRPMPDLGLPTFKL